MNDYICNACGPKWPGTYNCDLRCITCGGFVTPPDDEPVRDSRADPEEVVQA